MTYYCISTNIILVASHTFQLKPRRQFLCACGYELYLTCLTLDMQPPVIESSFANTTSVTITWSQSEFGLPVAEYVITVTRLVNPLCPLFEEGDISTTITLPHITSATFTSLQEFTNYTITVSANFGSVFGLPSPPVNDSTALATLEACKCLKGSLEQSFYVITFLCTYLHKVWASKSQP